MSGRAAAGAVVLKSMAATVRPSPVATVRCPAVAAEPVVVRRDDAGDQGGGDDGIDGVAAGGEDVQAGLRPLGVALDVAGGERGCVSAPRDGERAGENGAGGELQGLASVRAVWHNTHRSSSGG